MTYPHAHSESVQPSNRTLLAGPTFFMHEAVHMAPKAHLPAWLLAWPQESYLAQTWMVWNRPAGPLSICPMERLLFAPYPGRTSANAPNCFRPMSSRCAPLGDLRASQNGLVLGRSSTVIFSYFWPLDSPCGAVTHAGLPQVRCECAVPGLLACNLPSPARTHPPPPSDGRRILQRQDGVVPGLMCCVHWACQLIYSCSQQRTRWTM